MKYCIPFYYWMKTRAKTIFYKIGWIIIYVVPSYYISMFNTPVTFKTIISFMLVLISTHAIYENGYIENDIITVRREKTPTFRIINDKQKIEELYLLMTASRRIVAFACLVLLSYLNTGNVMEIAITLVFIDLTYAMHNSIRSEFNLITIALLTFEKYFAPVIFFNSKKEYLMQCIISIVFIFSIIRSLEHSKKYETLRNAIIINTDLLRFIYFTVLLIIGAVICIMQQQIYEMPMTLALYVWFYRTICLIKRKNKLRIYENEVKKKT